ncbi:MULTISPECIES: LysR substrate-binding domain-containing protein [Streptomyces]|uniref:LysR family transcriptional regulator n=2 Tax=Streptomyces TaxID=1883 RepID=A0A101PV04_STRCK|nr:LysR substrate-binding domain-containing protein [Streptomyces corchorusii]AEY86213.1 putative transcriptional regulator [Streptomyces hygroscopicus subsp. jinggangensis 5008]AGF60435.1 putative transcriptional regulator [Streptomyces hygroscopicus subsp. jinggangensis TL01]ALO99735.1 Putative transcriptional regulator [Streptomyces hygroscopicus subsp. limoneus]KUN18184.1 LysR family transcriptional regulator [Streptomyces corchorusii]
MFTLTQLTCFVAVAEELHFTRAAERLSMTQPPLSRQIQLLEGELGVRLLDRTNRTVRLTPAGRSFLAEARRIVRQAEHAALAVRRVSTGEAGSIAIGFTAASAYSALGELLESARRALPRVEILLHELVTRDQLEALSEGSLDLGLIRPSAVGPDLTARTAVREGLVAALPADHALAADDGPMELSAFDGEDFLMYSPTEARYFHELLLTTFRSAQVRPVFTQYLSQVHSILALVNIGWGIALVPEAAAEMRPTGVVYRPLHLPGHPRPVELDYVWRKSNDNPALHALLQLL